MELGNLLFKIEENYGNIYDDSNNHHIKAMSVPNFGIKKNDKLGPLKQDTFITIPQPQNINSKEINPDKELSQIIKQLSTRSAADTEIFIKYLTEISKHNTNNNPELLKYRIALLKEKASHSIHSINQIIKIGLKDVEQAAFLLDKLPQINKILTNKRISEFDQGYIFKILNKNNYAEFSKLAQSQITGNNFVTTFIYNSKPHEIKFGTEKVKVDSSEIISLLTGISSLSCTQTSSYDKFNETVKKLIVQEYRQNQPQYAQIAEAIMIQKPELAQIAKFYTELNAKWNTWLDDSNDVIRKQKQFFDTLDQKGILPKEIELKTMVPDQNALLNPNDTLNLFLLRQKE